jgi:hypothetical protein
MTGSRSIRTASRMRLLDQRGVALPLALVGVVFVSILVTGMLVTSSLESAMSRAHQDGVRSLYDAEAAVEGHLGATGGRLEAGQFNVGNHDIAVSRLREAISPPDPASETHPWAHQRRETFSLVSQPAAAGRGRSVGLLTRHTTYFVKLDTQIDGAATIGGQLVRMRGNVTVSSGASDSQCGVAESAIVLDSISEVDVGGNVKIEGGIEKRDVDAEQLLAQALGLEGLTIEEMTKYADHKFGVIDGKSYPAFAGSPRADGDYGEDHPFNWGCPVGMVSGCSSNEYKDHAPVIAIDASASGTVNLNNHHGQGMLLITNSHGEHRFEIGGNFSFKGIVLVDGSVKIAGTPRIHGALLVMGDGEIDASTMDQGTAEIRYDQCAIQIGEEAFTEASSRSGDVFINRTGWFEVVR